MYQDELCKHFVTHVALMQIFCLQDFVHTLVSEGESHIEKSSFEVT